VAAKTETLSFTFTDDGVATDLVFSVTQLPPSRALKLSARLGRVLGSALGELVEAGAGGSFSAMDITALGGAFQKLCAQLDDSEVDGLVSALLESVTFKTSQLTKNLSDIVFAGHLREFFQLLIFVVRVNFKDFFIGALGSAVK
jgi:hypothetical protein